MLLSSDDEIDLEQVDQNKDTDPLAVVDSGATKNYFKINSPVVNLHEINDGAEVKLPTGYDITATHQAEIPFHNDILSREARQCKIFPGLTQYALLSVGQLCDDGCNVSFRKREAVVTKNGKLLFKA